MSGVQEDESGYTSQACSSWGNRQEMPLSGRTYWCPCCGMGKVLDHNASLNILRLGLESRGQPPEATGFIRVEQSVACAY
ncbi:MAG: zinc ribbon domain-containing protein [Leptospirales bacterium]